MAIVATRVTVSTTATDLAGTDNQTRYQGDGYGMTVAVKVPTGGADVIIGGSSAVTTSTGYTLSAGESLAIDLRPGDELYGIVASSTQVLHVIRTDV